jgi:hypothetical protein
MKPSESEYIRIDLLDFFILDEFKGVRQTEAHGTEREPETWCKWKSSAICFDG